MLYTISKDNAGAMGLPATDKAGIICARQSSKGEAHQTHQSHEHDGLSSYKISFTEPLERKHFINAIKAIPRSIFRIKGVVEFTDADKPLLFQYVGGVSSFPNLIIPKCRKDF